MNRFEYTETNLQLNEIFLARDRNIRLYDGDQKTSFEGGEIIITTHRLFWGRPGAFEMQQICMAIPLKLIANFHEEQPGAFSFSRSRKVVLQLHQPLPDRNEGPQLTSNFNHIKLSFRDGFNIDIINILNDCLVQKRWEFDQQNVASTSKQVHNIKLRSGIGGIEKSLQEKHKATDESISIAFQDLSKLMTMAKDMVKISQIISNKIKEKQGDITEDETVRFKSYLLSLGIEDPVTRDAYKSNNAYYKSLAKQISDVLLTPITEVGGMMSLTDVYCRINRARGLELLSPEDLLNACRLMESFNLPLKLYEFDSGVKVLQLESLRAENVAENTLQLLEERGSITSEELAQHLGISVLLAKERLLSAEKFGKSCRDDSIEGLRFYPNLFLTQD